MLTEIAQPAWNKCETITNPIIGDEVTFLRTSAETRGKYTALEILLAPGGGNTAHYHTTFSETFKPVEGELTVGLGKSIQRVTPGETVTAAPYQSHYFANKTSKPIRFMVTLTPGNAGFEEGLRIAYGLARDGQTTKKGIPKKLSHLALLLFHTNTNMYGVFTLLIPFLKLAYKRALRKGVLKDLQKRYCAPVVTVVN
jgi:mannose-6-phosphate isomerase-like protein (cupin superfamily)